MKKLKVTVKVNDIRASKQVAKMLNCTQRTVSNLVKKEKLKPILQLGNAGFLFDVKDVEFYISKTNQKNK